MFVDVDLNSVQILFTTYSKCLDSWGPRASEIPTNISSFERAQLYFHSDNNFLPYGLLKAVNHLRIALYSNLFFTLRIWIEVLKKKTTHSYVVTVAVLGNTPYATLSRRNLHNAPWQCSVLTLLNPFIVRDVNVIRKINTHVMRHSRDTSRVPVSRDWAKIGTFSLFMPRVRYRIQHGVPKKVDQCHSL